MMSLALRKFRRTLLNHLAILRRFRDERSRKLRNLGPESTGEKRTNHASPFMRSLREFMADFSKLPKKKGGTRWWKDEWDLMIEGFHVYKMHYDFEYPKQYWDYHTELSPSWENRVRLLEDDQWQMLYNSRETLFDFVKLTQ